MTYYDVKSLYVSHRYKFFESGAYNLNLFGIRNKDLTVDLFNDTIGIAYKDDLGNEHVLTFQSTTDPGGYYLNENTGNWQGTAILIPNQYRSALKLGDHKKKYPALIQSEKATFGVWRDKNKDGTLDLNGIVYYDVSGLNLHTTSFKNDIKSVGAYSAGCQVIQDDKEFEIFMAVINKAAELYGNYFTYTLFD